MTTLLSGFSSVSLNASPGVLGPQVFSTICTHAESVYPFEACGLFLTPSVALPLPNSSKRPQKEFRVDPFVLHRHLKPYRGTHDILGIYHSHVDLPAYFSQKDKSVALNENGRPHMPDWTHIVVSVYGGKWKETRAFLWSEEQHDFEEIWKYRRHDYYS